MIHYVAASITQRLRSAFGLRITVVVIYGTHVYITQLGPNRGHCGGHDITQSTQMMPAMTKPLDEVDFI